MAISPPVLSRCLIEDLTDQGLPIEGDFWPGMSTREAAAVSISNSLLKKWVPETTETADQAALAKFLQSNELCRIWTLPVDIDSKSEMLLNGFKQAVESFWFGPGKPSMKMCGFAIADDLRDCFQHARVGPGANLLATGGSFYHKMFSSPLSCSDRSLYQWYQHSISRLPEWANAENIRQASYGSARVVRGSKLSFVPKNDRISRCICTEPTLNTFYQLGLGSILEDRLKSRFSIDLTVQQFKNRDLARLGSITDGLSTIDLSSASDSISLKMCQWALPPDMFKLLVKLRTPSTEVEGLGTQELHMISTMGNGYTFPLQTMLFACAVVACLHFRGIPESRGESDQLWGVYGDDIICPRLITSDVIHLLALLGFRVNDDKTFVEGPFRESCGSDFYCGTDIRGVYLKKLETEADFYVAINLLHQFETKTDISLQRLVGCLFREFKTRGRRPLLVPPWENMDSGIRTPNSVGRTYARRLSKSDPNMKYYYALRPIPRRVCIGWGRIVVPKSCKPLIYNPSGLLISFLQQGITGDKTGVTGYIGVRDDCVVFTRKRCATSMWHQIGCPDRDSENYGLDWGRWETTVVDSLVTNEVLTCTPNNQFVSSPTSRREIFPFFCLQRQWTDSFSGLKGVKTSTEIARLTPSSPLLVWLASVPYPLSAPVKRSIASSVGSVLNDA